MSVIQINIVVLVTLFCFVNLVSCDSYSWGEWRTYKGCQQTGIFSGWRVDMRACYRLDDSDVRHEERDSRKCSQMTDKFRIVKCQNKNEYYLLKKYFFIEQFQYPSGTPGSKHGTPFKYTVPTDGCYRISATGASGYQGPHYASGATATGVFKLNSGLELTIVVGKHSGGSDAGGGTFVFTVTKDNTRGDLYVVGGGAAYSDCSEGDINCQYNGQDGENGGGDRGGRNGGGGGCNTGYSCNGSGAGWLSSGCGDDSCDRNGKSFEGAFVGGSDGGYGGGGFVGGGGYSGGGGFSAGGGGSFVNSKASHSNKHKNLPTSTRHHGTASIELVDDNQC